MKLIQSNLTLYTERLGEYINFIICRIREQVNAIKKSYIDQIPGYPGYIYIRAGHYGLFKYR
jgi:hypothetical protein